MPRWTAADDPHPFIRLGDFSGLFQDLDPCLIRLQVPAAILNLANQIDQRFEDILKADNPMRHAGSPDIVPQAFQHLFQAVQRQAIRIFRGDDVRQQRRGGNAFTQRVDGALRGNNDIEAMLLKHRLFLPDLQHFQLSRNEEQLFFDLGEEDFAGTDFFRIGEGQFNTLAYQRVREAALTFFSDLGRNSRLFR